jgi:hypothetical protein
MPGELAYQFFKGGILGVVMASNIMPFDHIFISSLSYFIKDKIQSYNALKLFDYIRYLFTNFTTINNN